MYPKVFKLYPKVFKMYSKVFKLYSKVFKMYPKVFKMFPKLAIMCRSFDMLMANVPIVVLRSHDQSATDFTYVCCIAICCIILNEIRL